MSTDIGVIFDAAADVKNVQYKASRQLKKAKVKSGHTATLAATFDELPLPFDDWVTSPDHMALDHTYSAVQREILRHAEQIYYPELYTSLATESLAWRPVRFVNLLWLMIGKGGGKDHMAALTQLRIAYLLMCLRNPQRYYDIGTTSDIHLFNASTSEGHGTQVYYAEFKGLLENSPWFRGKCGPLSKETRFDKRIVSISGNSKEDSGEGYNLMLAVLDEIDAFRTKEEMEQNARTQRGKLLNAEGIADTVIYSASSRFPGRYKVIGLSWPRFVGSFIHSRHTKGLTEYEERGEASTTYVIPREHGAATWEANPTKTKAMYAEDYLRDPETSKARYECQPPQSESPYFRNHRAIDDSFSIPFPDGEPPLDIRYWWGSPLEQDYRVTEIGLTQVTGMEPKEGFQTEIRFADWFRCRDNGYSRAVHVDIGLRRDRCGFAMSHVRGHAIREIERYNEHSKKIEKLEVPRPLVTVDLVTYFEAPFDSEHGHGEVELRWVRSLIFQLIGLGFPIRYVTFDGFQSADSIQLLNSWGIEAEVFSLDRTTVGYDTAKSVLYEGGMLANPHKLLQSELKRLTLVRGKKIDHPPNGSKDLADAWAGSVRGAIHLADEGGGLGTEHVWTGTVEAGMDRALGLTPPDAPSPNPYEGGNVLTMLPSGLDSFAGPPRR